MDKPLRPITTAPAEVITLEQARLHLKLDTDVSGSPPTHPDDDLITRLITVAREAAENYTGRAIAQQQYELALDAFPSGDEVSLQTSPVTAIDSVTYVDTAGATQTLSAGVYHLDDYQMVPAMRLGWSQQWPATRDQGNAVKITFTAGSTDTDSPNTFPCPMAIMQAMLLTIGHLYENRQSTTGTQRYELPDGVKALLTPYRINMGV